MDRSDEFDVAVIGGGVVGAALARELSAYNVSVCLIEGRTDINEGTSKANTAILHTGYDAHPGTLEAQLVAKGYHLLSDYCDQANICYERRGAVLVAWNSDQLEALPSLKENAEKNGYHETRMLNREEVFEYLPHAAETALGAVLVPGESIIDPWSVPVAFVEDAINRGASLFTDSQVTGIDSDDSGNTIHTSRGDIRATWVVNAAGLGADVIDSWFGNDRLENHPRKGQLIVFDKLASRLLEHIVLPVPTKMGKGVLVSPTVFGNVMLGPTAEDMEDREDTSTTQSGFDYLLEKGQAMFPDLLHEEVTSTYSGLRAAHNLTDYLLDVDGSKHYAIAGAIRSTGLTSALAVADYLTNKMIEAGFSGKRISESELPPTVKMPPLGERMTRPFQNDELIQQDPAYGTLVCFCERVSEGEIRDTFATGAPPQDLQSLRRRTRAMNGRCQGFFCGANVSEMFTRMHKEAR